MDAQEKSQSRHITDITITELELMISWEVQRQLAARRSSEHRSPETLEATR